MIVAKQPNASSALDEELTKLLDSKDVKEYLNVHFETLQKIAGTNKDTQEISTLVFNDRDEKLIDSYVSLHDRDRNKTLRLSNDGAIISEKMAKLLNLKVGDTITCLLYTSSAQDLVVAELTGDKKVVNITFADAVVDADDVETLQDMTVQALNNALEQIDEATKKSMGAFAGKLPF